MRRAAFAIVVSILALSGCLAKANECGDGTVCPMGSVCVASGGCALPEQVAACSGKGEGDPCTVGGAVGACIGGVCIGNQCGNGQIDPGEVCDGAAGVDANSGEACSSNCDAIYRCGNGVTDPGEQCDDDNANPSDGCDACRATTWLATAVIPGNTSMSSLAVAPGGIGIDLSGRVYFGDMDTGQILRRDPDGTITTIAGTTAGFAGDYGPALDAELASPSGVAVDGLGNVYVADTNSNRIRMIDTHGIIKTIAGTGAGTFGGDGGPATSAAVFLPAQIAVDGLGDVYFADRGNDRIRRIDANGIITTVAGNGVRDYTGDGGPATAASLAQPFGLALDPAGDLWIADSTNNVIRKVDTTGTITTVAGAGFDGDGGPALTAAINLPISLAFDGTGALYMACAGTDARIRKIDAGGIITTLAGGGLGYAGDGGPASAARFKYPDSVGVDPAGNIFVADNQNYRLRRIDAMSGIIATVAGNGGSTSWGDGGTATSTSLGRPRGPGITAAGAVIVADDYRNNVRQIDPSGVITTIAGTGAGGFAGDGGPATAALLSSPTCAAVRGNEIYICDTGNQRIRRIDANGIITTIAGTGAATFSGDNGAATSAALQNPQGLAFDAAGNLYIADLSNQRIRRIDPSGTITTFAGTGSTCATSTAACGDGAAASSAQLAYPSAVAVDGAGNVFIADNGDSRVRKVDTSGVITTVAGTGSVGDNGDGGPATAANITYPWGVTVDSGGNLLVADGANYVRKIDSGGVITTVAGNGGAIIGGLPAGDGGPATSATLYNPQGIVADASGAFYVTEQSRVLRVDPAPVISTIGGAVDPGRMGPFGQAHLAEPMALAVGAPHVFIAGGASGTVQDARLDTNVVAAVAGRYPQSAPTANLARFRDMTFGSVGGVAYDSTNGVLYLSETSGNRVDMVTVTGSAPSTWTIATLAGDATGTEGFRDGPAASALFREPTGLYLDETAHMLYVADTGNHVIRAIDVVAKTVSTFAGTPQTYGFFGDGGAASASLLYRPQAIARCPDGDFYIADTSNERVRRISNGMISTVLGVGTADSAGDGAPSSARPVDSPLGVVCDASGNVFVTSRTTVRMLPWTSDASPGLVDGSGPVETIYGTAPRTTFPASVTTCLAGIAVVDDTKLWVSDSCSGLIVDLTRVTPAARTSATR